MTIQDLQDLVERYGYEGALEADQRLGSLLPEMVLENGVPRIKGVEESKKYRVKNKMYININNKCKSSCSHCRNKNLKLVKTNEAKLLKSFKAISPYMNVTYLGGGEPLLTPRLIQELYNESAHDSEMYFITSAPRKLFYEYVARYGDLHPNIGRILTRQRLDDKANDDYFGNEMLRLKEINGMLRIGRFTYFPSLDTILSTLTQDGGINTAEEMAALVQAFDNNGIKGAQNVFFNTLQKEVTGEEYFSKNEVNASEIRLAKRIIKKIGFSHIKSSVSAGGYSVETYRGGKLGDQLVGFQQYHESSEETAERWRTVKRSRDGQKRLGYDFSMMPNGKIFADKRFASGVGQELDINNLDACGEKQKKREPSLQVKVELLMRQ